jgi:hypothetical protein
MKKKIFFYLPTDHLEGRVAKGETNNFLRLALSVFDWLFKVYSIIYSASFDQIYLKTIKDISSKSIDIISKVLNTIHLTTKNNWMKKKNCMHL